MSPGCCWYVKFRIEKHCRVKHFAFLNTFVPTSKHCALSNLLFFYELLIGPQPTFSECIVISKNLIGQLCLSGPGYSSRTLQ